MLIYIGSQGFKGDLGSQGIPGADGSPGATGMKGEKGDTGPLGSSSSSNSMTSGVTYTRWGNSSCPSEASLVYAGWTGSSGGTDNGGGANYVCMPNDPEDGGLPLRAGTGHINVHVTEYEDPISSSLLDDHNPPCAVCYASAKSTVITIPAKTTCPTGWTVEYYGYLMSERNRRTMYECVDAGMESIAGSGNSVNSAGGFWHVEADCSSCSYSSADELTCVVCSK